MALIKKLPDAVANKIAAGEVVQRPASVVKELVENAIDAGADDILVLVKDAGKTLIQVIDNGCGMASDDAVLAFERFATSKISDVEDLENLHTLGFRGEALASIAAVAQVELKTKRREDTVATLVRIEGGMLQDTAAVQGADGTSVSVRNLFFNIPARRKFLKSNATEFKHIYEAVQAQALVHTDIAFALVSDGEDVFRLKSGSLPERLDAFFGQDFSKGLIEVSGGNSLLSLKGYISKPAMMKRSKNEQFLFINERVVHSRLISHAVMQAFGELLLERQQPFFCLHLTLPPRHIDVNVHPSKMEVKFEDERNVYNLVYAIVRDAVRQIDYAPTVKLEEKSEAPLLPISMHSSSVEPEFIGLAKRLRYETTDRDSRTSRILYEDYQTFRQATASEPSNQRHRSSSSLLPDSPQQLVFPSDTAPPEEKTNERFVWQVHNKYILTQIKSGLMIIDQHVAHERILYERALAIMNSGVPHSQQLLFPHRIELKPWEAEILEQIRDDLIRLGFSFRMFGSRTLLVEGIPPDVRPGSEERILQEILEQYQTYTQTLSLGQRERLAASYACRSSIMAGDRLTAHEMQVLIDQLFATSMPYVCPHGRPIIIKLSLEELDKMFGRT
ncbi:MAG: DNA mismatch repair endonuclease MutL [Chloroherpetonaceae bacterium]|nr:DNA mismatch repair endonuclease MutL [Chloroherpetonaceae bacterium]MCS7210732.1 DNA mismatch repair endonuclease MutL [Chloroherpetonaceae bacterium]